MVWNVNDNNKELFLKELTKIEDEITELYMVSPWEINRHGDFVFHL